MVQAILFDLFETLITESRDPPSGVSSLAAEFGCAREAFRAEWRTRRPAVMPGRLLFRQAIGDIVATLGGRADEAALQRICDDRVRAKGRAFAQIDPLVLTTIDHLRSRGLRLGVISNCFAEDVVAWPQSSLASRFDCTSSRSTLAGRSPIRRSTSRPRAGLAWAPRTRGSSATARTTSSRVPKRRGFARSGPCGF